jgi:hypothetical protein
MQYKSSDERPLWYRRLVPRLETFVAGALHTIVIIATPIVFYVVVTPCGLILRAVGQPRTSRLRPDASAATYWTSRADHPPSSMDLQR